MTSARSGITRDPLEPAGVMSAVADPGHGAILVFLGTVRNHADGRPVTGMTYEAYEAMAHPVLAAIVEEAEEMLDGGRAAAWHRVGELEIGEVSVAIAVASAHRDAAYRASRHVIEEIKKRLPVWKREHYADGPSQWVEGTDPRQAAADHSSGAGAGGLP